MSAIHPHAQALLSLIRASGRPPSEALSPEEARSVYTAGRVLLQPPRDDVAEIRDIKAPGKAGGVPLRLYLGVGTSSDQALPCLVYLHGGGWVLGDIECHDWVCRRLANEARCSVVAVDYRLAPEHRFPASLDDCAAALTWVADNAAECSIDAAQIAVGGDSAGGNLAAALALMGRDGAVPRSMFQALLYPAVDLTMASKSYERITEGVPLTANTMRYFVDHYAPKADDRTDWRASPSLAPSLKGCPPAFVLTCGHDPLCGEAREYASRLESEGVRVTALHLSDHVHGILTMGKVIGATDGVMSFIAAALRDAWRTAAGKAP